MPPTYIDLAALSEPARIAIIIATAAKGKVVGCVVSNEAAADRYAAQLAGKARIIDRRPIEDTDGVFCILLRVGPLES